jgi:high-affinity iron transporter
MLRTFFRGGHGAVAALFVCVSVAAPAHGADATKGKGIYDGRCAFCHGISGKGDGPAGAALDPKPTNFGNADFWKKTSPEAMKEVIEHGKRNTAMVPFGASLSAEQIGDLMAYLQTFKAGQ